MLEKITGENAGKKEPKKCWRKAHENEYWKFSQSRKSQSIIQEKLYDKPSDILIFKEKPFSLNAARVSESDWKEVEWKLNATVL